MKTSQDSLFLAKYNPQCDGKYVYLDQGVELFNHPEVQNLFKKKIYLTLLTTFCGMILRHLRLKLQCMLVLTRE